MVANMYGVGLHMHGASTSGGTLKDINSIQFLCGSHKLLTVIAGGASYLLGPRFCFLAVESNPSTSYSLLRLPSGSWTGINLRLHFGHANEEWCTNHYLSSTVISG